MPKVNFSAVAEGKFPVRDAGEYPATLTSYKWNAASKSSGNPTLTFVFQEEDSNKQIWKTYSLQPQALFGLKRDLVRLGADMEMMNSDDADLDEILEPLIGAACVVVMGDPRSEDDKGNAFKDKDGNPITYETFKEIKDPTKVS